MKKRNDTLTLFELSTEDRILNVLGRVCIGCKKTTNLTLRLKPTLLTKSENPSDYVVACRECIEQNRRHQEFRKKLSNRNKWISMPKPQGYNAYIASPTWAAVRKAALERAGGLCRSCERAVATDVHHYSYEEDRCWGFESPSDVIAVCQRCHDFLDEERRKKNQQEFERRKFEGWATKVYGEDWHRYDYEAYETYEDWCMKRDC